MCVYSTSTGMVQIMINNKTKIKIKKEIKSQVYISFVLFNKHWNGPKAEASVSAL
jgi:hypothetical protein